MKIKNKNSIYVQAYDIEFLLKETDILLPYSIMKLVWSKAIDFEYKDEFIKFKDKESLEFFNRYEFILDYKNLIELPIDKLIEIKSKLVKNKNKLNIYLLKSINKIILIKNKQLILRLPNIPKKNGFKLSDEKKEFSLQESINENTLILKKTDKGKFNSFDEIPISLLNTGFNLLVLQTEQKFLIENNYIMKTKFSDDYKSLIIEYKPNMQKKLSKRKKLFNHFK